MPAELNEILDEWRTATGPHIVQASEMRRMAAEVDQLRAEGEALRGRERAVRALVALATQGDRDAVLVEDLRLALTETFVATDLPGSVRDGR